MPKLSQWFGPETKPALPGVYQRNYGGKEQLGIVYSYFDGKQWGIFGWTPQDAEFQKWAKSTYNGFKWRGLASNPAGEQS